MGFHNHGLVFTFVGTGMHDMHSASIFIGENHRSFLWRIRGRRFLGCIGCVRRTNSRFIPLFHGNRPISRGGTVPVGHEDETDHKEYWIGGRVEMFHEIPARLQSRMFLVS